MSDNEQASIDLSVNADAAVETMKELAAAALKADDAFQQLKQHQVELANAIPGNRPVSTYNEAAARFQQMDPSLIRDTYPAVAQTQNAITAQATNVRTQAMDFVGTNPQAAGQPATALLGQFQQFMAQQQQAQQAASGASYQAPPPPPGQEGLRYGPAVPPEMDRLARYGYDKAQSMDARDAARQQQQATPLGGSDTTQQDRAASTMGERFAQALTRSAGGMLSGGISGAANAAGMGATGDLVGALARPLMELVSAPLAFGAAVIGGAAGIGLGVNNLQSRYAGEERQLAGSIGTSTGATPEGELTTAQNAGWRYWYHEKDSVAAAQQLGDMGVTSNQMGGALTQSMALARLSGLGLDQTVGLTGQMMQGGMSSNQVGQAYAELDQVSKLVPVSLGRITEGIKAVNAAAGVGQISLNGLAATQALSDTTGMKINIGQAMAGTIGSTGTSALAQGYMLGLDPTAFSNAQKDPAQLWDAYANTARRYDVGSGGSRIAQQALSEAGFDFSGMKGNQADTFIQKLVSEGPGAAQKYEQSLQQKENAPHAAGPHTADQFAAAGKAFADQVTPIGDKLKIGGEQGAAALVRGSETAANDLANAIKHHDLTRVSADTGGSTRDRIQRERKTDPQAYIADTYGNTSLTATQHGPYSNTFDSYKLNAAQANGLTLPGGAHMTSDTFLALQQASQRSHDPLAVLLAQAGQEATNPRTGLVDSSIVSGDGGVGLGQFGPGPHNENLPSTVQYLNQASRQLGDGTVTASNWRQAALNPKIAAQAMADYDASNYASKQAGGRWDHALAQYQGGPNGWNYTGHPGQGRDYGTSVDQGALKVEVQLGGSVDITQNGQKVGSAQAGQHIRAKATHSVDPSKKHVAASSYGPTDRTPPPPGLPNLPGHIK